MRWCPIRCTPPFPLVLARRPGFCLVPVAVGSSEPPGAWLSRAVLSDSSSPQHCRCFSRREGHGACRLATRSPETPWPRNALSPTPDLASKGEKKGRVSTRPPFKNSAPKSYALTANASRRVFSPVCALPCPFGGGT